VIPFEPTTAAMLEGKINAEGRVVVPAAIRRVLGVGSGDRILFVTDEAGNVRLTSANAVIQTVWANNHGGDAGDSGDDVRELRDADRLLEQEREQEIAEQDASDLRTDDQVADALFDALDLR
jgi:AbrB family looped-hinge helix DNA binding protein